MIYTVGHEESYDKGLIEFGEMFQKTGRTSTYAGGFAMKTYGDAKRLLGEPVAQGRDWAIYEIDADWERDTTPSDNGWWHALLKDSRVLQKAKCPGGCIEGYIHDTGFTECNHCNEPEPILPRSTLIGFQKEVGKWARKTFPGISDQSKLEHLRDEVGELMAAPTDASEMADCLIILLHHADAHGIDLLEAARLKFTEVQLREWGKPDERGVIRHTERGSNEVAP